MNEIERDVSIEQVDYNIDINDNNYTIEIDSPNEYVIDLNQQGPQGLRGFTGNGISSYTLTSSSGLVDTYTITFTDGETTTVNVTNGRGISSITGPVSVGNIDTYTINYNDGTTSTFTVANGIDGVSPTIAVGSTTTGAPGTNASVVNSGTSTNVVLDFTIPKGDKGDTGSAATISVGSTTTGAAGTSASVTNSGTSSAAVLDFVIPQGVQGETGATGADGYSPTATVTKSGDTATITITDKNGTTTATVSDGSSGASSVSQLTDVDLTNLSNGDVLVYDSTSQEWKAEAQSGGVDLVAGTDLEIVPLLPSGYTQLKSITATGSQYINTGLWLTDNFKAEIVGRFTSTSGNQCLLGSSITTPGATYKNIVLAIDGSKYFTNSGNPWLTNQTNSTATLDTNKHTFVVEITSSNAKIKVDSVENTGTYESSSIEENLFIFARNANSMSSGYSVADYAQFEAESIRLYDNGNLVFNGVPAKYGNQAGLYDTISETFMPSLGTSDFVAGEEISTQDIINFTNESGYIKSASVSSLTDVTLSSPANGQSLVYNSTSQKWENQTIQSGGITDVEVNGESVVTGGVAEIDLSHYQTTIEAGDNITVKQPVTIRVPSGYTQLERISSSSGACCIDTGLIGEIQWEIDVVGISPYPTKRALIATSTTGSSFFGQLSGTYWATNGGNTSVSITTRIKLIIDFTASNCSGTINDIPFSYTDGSTLTTNWVLFGASNYGSRLYGHLYSAIARRNGLIVFDGVPAKRDSDDAVGLYDVVSGNFFTSATSTGFTAGTAESPNAIVSANVGNGTLTISRYGTTLATFTANQTGNATANISNPAIQPKEIGTSSILNSSTVKATNSLLYCGNDNLVHSYTETNVPISMAYGMFVNSSQLSANSLVTYYYKGEKLSWTVPSALRNFTSKHKVWAKCTYPDSSGNVYFVSLYDQDGTTNGLQGGYTYYYLGCANSTSTVALDVTGSHFLSINTDGKLTHIDGVEVSADLSGKANIDLSNCTRPYVTETYHNGASWYRVYSDGFCEQGGSFDGAGAANTFVKVSLLKPYANTNYTVVATNTGTITTAYSVKVGSGAKNETDGFYIALGNASATAWWQASGYIS